MNHAVAQGPGNHPARFVARLLTLAAVGLLLSTVTPAILAKTLPASNATQAPEAATGFQPKPLVTAQRFMIATANPQATAAGLAILKQGGSAVDAAIAAQMVLNLVEPQSSGIGGGAFLMHWDARRLSVVAHDGRETAPQAASERLFLDADGKALKFHDAVVGGRSVGTPGLLRMLENAHRQHGKLKWASLFQPAIRLADQGFAVSPRLHHLLSRDAFLKSDPVALRHFYDLAGQPHPVGYRLRNPELAKTLRSIARRGSAAFYGGPIARAMVDKVNAHATNPGLLSLQDLRNYRAKTRAPVCSPYRRWIVCGVPPPSSGGVAVAQILGILAQTDIAGQLPRAGVAGAEAVHLYSEAARLAYADRAVYLADPDFVPLVDGLLDPSYLAARAGLIGARSMGRASAGSPRGVKIAFAPDQGPEMPGTSHLSIIDAQGNAVAMTSTIEDAFGARQMVRGFLLNNQLTDFSFVAVENGQPVANRVEGGKRPRSSMAPTLVFEAGPDGRPQRLIMSIGSPGGSAIINYVGKALIATLDWGMNMQDAIALPNFGSRNGPTEIEQGRLAPDTEAALVDALKSRGHDVRLMEQTSGLQGIMRTRQGWEGGADPRREGVVQGN